MLIFKFSFVGYNDLLNNQVFESLLHYKNNKKLCPYRAY